MTSFDPTLVPEVRIADGARKGSALAMAIGVVLLAIGAIFDPMRALYAYLAAFCELLTIALGALVLLMTVHAMNAGWPVPIRRVIEAIASTLVVLAIAFVPIAIFVDPLYPWTDPAGRLPAHAQALLHEKEPWLRVGFFVGRAVVYWASWLVVLAVLLRWSARQDMNPAPELRVKQRALSAGALPLVSLTLTFAAFDWMMSLDPVWFSTIYGLDAFAGGFEAAIGVATIFVAVLDARGRFAGLVSGSHYYALGRMLLAFVIFWAYIVFFQFFLIWIGNKPEEVAYYLRRLDGGWSVVAGVIVIGHFVVPFVALLSYRLKWRPRALAVVGAWLVLMHLVDVHWKIVPALDGAWIVHFADVGALLLLGGACTLWMARRYHGRPVAPRMDPMLPKGARYFSD